MAIPNPNPNIADGMKCDNKTYSSNKIESLIKTATELPIPEAGDAGKVLTVNEDLGYELDAVPDELPTPESGDAGKVLTVNAGETGYELTTPVDPTSIIDDAASSASTVYSSDKVDTLLTGKADTTSLPDILRVSASLDDQSVTAGTSSVIDFTYTPVTGYKVIGAFDDSYWANVIGTCIRIRDNGTISMNYYAPAGFSNRTLSIKIIMAKNVTDQ